MSQQNKKDLTTHEVRIKTDFLIENICELLIRCNSLQREQVLRKFNRSVPIPSDASPLRKLSYTLMNQLVAQLADSFEHVWEEIEQHHTHKN